MVRLSILGSGSGGNAAVISAGNTHLLLDCGFSHRELCRRMVAAGLDPGQLNAILITHEHSDHVAGLPRLAAQSLAPVFLNEATRAALGKAGDKLERVEPFLSGQTFTVGAIEVTSFSIPHDAADPVAFSFRAEGVKIVVVTDLGYLSENVKDQLRGAHGVVIESNHDLEMLKGGGYPWSVKQRVMSRVGHLSNDGLAEYLAGDFDGTAAHLVLAHLSENNNLPELALLSAQHALARRAGGIPALRVALQSEPLAPLCF